MVNATWEMSSGVALQLGTGPGLVLAVALCGVAVFLLVLLLRIYPLVHKPRVTRRVEFKPLPDMSTVGTMESGPATGTIGSSGKGVVPPVRQPMVDRGELLQAKSQWERLIQEAESNEQLTNEQRATFVAEARKNISEINRQLGRDEAS
jgi:hypothetical protein